MVSFCGPLIIPIGGNTFTFFVVTVLQVNFVSFPVLMPLHLYNVAQPGFTLGPGETEPERKYIMGRAFAWPRYWKWTMANTSLSFGSWLGYYVLGAIYVFVVGAGWGKTANISLPLMVAVAEAAVVLGSQVAFHNLALPMRPSGDQWLLMSECSATTHMFAESVKLVAMVSGAAFCEDNPNGLKWPSEGSCDPFGWITGLATGLVVTSCGRMGWPRFAVCRLLRSVGLKKLAKTFGPSTVTKLHDEAKYYCGYTRFAVPAAVFIANVITGKEAIIFTNANSRTMRSPTAMPMPHLRTRD
jgi:hypothetical protein